MMGDPRGAFGTAAIRIYLRSLAFFALVALFGPASALDRGLTLDQLSHDRWGRAEGAPLDISSIAQTPDGFLWLASPDGLFRFDGVRFERISAVSGTPLLPDGVRKLAVDRSGALWVGYRLGGISVIRGGSIDNMKDRHVGNFAVDKAGGVWTVSRIQGVSRFANGSWTSIDDRFGFEKSWTAPGAPLVDRAGDVWLPILVSGREPHVARFTQATGRFAEVDYQVDGVALAQTPDGTMWAADLWGLRPLALARRDDRHPPQSTESWIKPGIAVGPITPDRDGALWMTLEHGLGRLRFPELLKKPGDRSLPPEPETFGPQQGLSSDYVPVIFEDREGSIWVGTANGLDRFRDSRVATVKLPRRDRPFALAAGDGGTMWACNSYGQLMKVSASAAMTNDDGRPQIENVDGTGNSNLAVLYKGRDGVLWVGSYYGRLWRGKDGRLEPVEWGGEGSSGGIYGLTQDSNGDLWVGALGGTYQVTSGKWINRTQEIFGTHKSRPSSAWASGLDGEVWTKGYANGAPSLLRFHAGNWSSFSEAAIGVGPIIVLQSYGSDLWIGGERGVSVRTGGRFVKIQGEAGETFERTSGIVATAAGDVWFNGKAGASHIAAQQLAAALGTGTYRVKYTRLDASDHLLGFNGDALEPVPSAALGSDGRVWLSTSAGLHWLDPSKQLTENAKPVPALITHVTANGTVYAGAAPMRLPQGTRDLVIEYTAPSLAFPTRVRFRYRLIGLDDGWQDAGSRRQAFYTNLGPGRYEFLVNATNGFGEWAAEDTRFRLEIAPAFWQTLWFHMLCAMLGIAAIWLAFRLRIKVLQRRMSQTFQEIVAERERIARELHDTFLQAVQALILRVHLASKQLGQRIPSGDSAIIELERSLAMADQVMTEGRDRVLDLRTSLKRSEELSEAIASLGSDLSSLYAVPFQATLEGEKRRLATEVEAEVFGIVREGMLNAFRHAKPESVEVDLVYGEEELQVRIRDDGVGIEANLGSDERRPGHWGLQGMRERTAKMHGTLKIWSGKGGAGTEIELRIAAVDAYAVAIDFRHWWSDWRSLVKL